MRCRIGGLLRHGMAAVDVVRRRVLPFDPAPPDGALPISVAIGQGVAYVAYRSEAEELTFPDQGVRPAYAHGLLIVAGYSAPFGQGTSIAAYDPRTGRRCGGRTSASRS
jgi:hypothetical protein